MRTIGIAGTAKNTGKTTTTLEIIRQSVAARLRNAVTSIGYDGEDRDNITGLPKPRYFLPRGMYVATAERCLRAGSARYVLKTETKIRTILGPIVVAEITEPGLVVVAGPNRGTDLQFILDIFQGLGVDLAIVDGALNRIVPLIRSDGLIVGTGAALDDRISCLADHAKALHSLFAPELVKDRARWTQWITLTSGVHPAAELQTGSLLSEVTALQIRRFLKRPICELVIPGACDVQLLQRLLDGEPRHLGSARLILGSPLKLVASSDPLAWSHLFAEAPARVRVIEYLEKIPFLFMTVNPFYPRYLPTLRTYEPATVDKEELLAAVKDKLPGFPVFDIQQPPIPDLLPLLGIPR